ncbi:MAG: NADH-quinone oxidoreductase subunit M [Propionibacteriaceae bacterium]|jgi:NADH-quinone oxidoreductase subunit M|nr:NADH-quinone oxidoreductase subunit M [Propionibacteriaceae bacterium]
MTFPWLTALAVLPLLGACLIGLVKAWPGRLVGLVTALASLALGGWVAWLQVSDAAVDLSERVGWLDALGSAYALRLDGMGLAMVLLTVVLVPLVLIAEWRTGAEPGPARFSSGTFSALVLLVESCSLFVFLADDAILFYVFFEASLIPMYFLIGGFGSDPVKRSAAAVKFLLFGLAGGLLMLFALVGTGALSARDGQITMSLTELAARQLSGSALSQVVFVGFFLAFALKAPMVPGHTWLPQAAAQSTGGGAALMVGVLDKLGTFGMVRFCLVLFPQEAHWATPVIIGLAVLSILYGAFAALGQRDLLRLVAFTSISHFGFMVLGLFTLTTSSLTGSIFYMVNHGLSTGALFLLIGYLVDRRGSAQVSAFGGLAKVAPVLAGFTLVAGLGGLALPGTSSFVSEFMVMAGAWSRFPLVAALAALGTVFAALYILWTYQRLMTGPLNEAAAERFSSDLPWRQRLAVAPLLFAILALGFFPRPALDLITPTSQTIMTEAGATDLAPVVKGVK